MPKKSNNKELTPKEAFLKLASYCAYQERCEWEVRQKLLDLGIRGDDVETIVYELKEENFLNEKRFAEHFAGGKFRVKGWGRMKISQGLMQKRVADHLIHHALNTLDEDDYKDTLFKLLSRKRETLDIEDKLKLKRKLIAFANSRGFEPNLIWEIIKEMDL